MLNKTPESCQINWLAAGGPGEEGYEVVVVVVVVGGGVLGPGIHAREPQRGMCVSHCVIIPVPALPEQNLAHPAESSWSHLSNTAPLFPSRKSRRTVGRG